MAPPSRVVETTCSATRRPEAVAGSILENGIVCKARLNDDIGLLCLHELVVHGISAVYIVILLKESANTNFPVARSHHSYLWAPIKRRNT